MATGYTSQISTTYLGAKIRFYYSTTYNAASNTSIVSLRPLLYTATNTGSPGCTGYKGNVYGNGNSIYAMDSSYGGSYTLRAAGTYNSEAWFDPHTGSLSTFTISHDNNGYASFNAGFVGKLRANIDGTETNINGGTGCTATIHENAPYAISYNANGGTGAPSSQSIYGNVSYNLSTTRPTRTGYTFLGWSTSSTATTASYQPGQSVTPNGNLALYAVWQINSYTLSISQGTGSTISVLKNGTSLSDGATIYYNDSLSITIGANTGYNISTHTVNGNNWTTGTLTVTGAVSVISTATLIQYTLSITTSQQGVTTNVQRLTSPIGGGSIGAITNGAVLYYNDTISINYTLGGAYQLLTATVNGNDISEEILPYETTVTTNIVLSITVKLGAIMYIANEAYQIFIGDGTNWNQYQAFIGNGSEFDQY